MKMLTVTNNKGGVGKTSISTTLARYALSDQKRVLFLDFDVQGNASSALNEFINHDKVIGSYDFFTHLFNENEINTINQAEQCFVAKADPRLANSDELSATEAIDNCLKNLALLNYDLIILDTSPTLSNTLLIATGVSRDVLIPIEPSKFSIEGVKRFLTVMVNFRKRLLEQKLPCDMKIIGMVVNKMEYGKPRRKAILQEINDSFSPHVLNSVIGNRDAIAEAMDQMVDLRTLKSYSAKKAKIEFEALYNEVMEKLRE